MTTDRLPFFLAFARDWRTAADALRAAGVSEDDPVLRVWRAAAWCHVLCTRGQSHAALSSLRAVVRELTGESPSYITESATDAEAMSAAAEWFERLRAAVSARYPYAFDRMAAA